MSSLEDIYNSKLMELAANSPGSGRLGAPDATATAHSKLCGSTVTIDLNMDGDQVADYRQTVKACLLGQSSASIMARYIVGSTAAELRDVGAQTRTMLKSGGPVPSGAWPEGKWRELALLEPVREFKARHASTLLVFDAVEDALAKLERQRGSADATGRQAASG